MTKSTNDSQNFKKSKKQHDRRINIACEQCRRLHVKCDGQPVCGRCVRTQSKCVYVEGDKKIMISLRLLNEIKRENELLKMKLAAATNSSLESSPNSGNTTLDGDTESPNRTPTSGGAIEGSGSNTPKPTYTQPTIENLVIPISQLAPTTQASVGNYMGMSSMTMFGLEIQGFLPDGTSHAVNLDEITHHKLPLVPHIFQRENNHYTVHITLECRHEPFVVEFRLPSYDLALACINEVETYLDGCFYFFNPAEFKRNLERVYQRPVFGKSTYYDVLWYIELLVVLSMGENFLTGNSQWATKYKHEFESVMPDETPGLGSSSALDGRLFPGMRFFRRAHCLIRIMIYDIQANPSVRAVEVLSMCTFYFQMGDCMSGSYVYSGMTIRVAQLLGMHVDADKSIMDEFELEHRRRLWWSIYHVDRYIAAKAGLPVCLTDQVYTSGLPRDLTQPLSSTPTFGMFPRALYLNAFVDVSKITNIIITDLYYRPPGSTFDILPVLTNIINKFFEWRDKWPTKLNVDWRNSQGEFTCSRGAANIFSEYFHCINLAVRPLLCHFVRKRVFERNTRPDPIRLGEQSENVSILLNASLGASIQTIQCLYNLMNKDLFGLNTHLDREYVFSSASTLLLFYAAFGECSLCCPSIERAISILQRCEDIGNERAMSRKKQLLNLARAFEFLHPTHLHTSQYFLQVCSQTLDTVIQHTRQIMQDSLPCVVGGPLKVTNTSFLDFEAELWSEISNEGIWLGNVSEEISSWLNEATR